MAEHPATRSRRFATMASMGGGLASVVIASVGAFIVVPFALHAIGPRLYGAWLASGDVFSWTQSFDLGLPNLMIQRIATAHGREDAEAAGTQFATGMAILAVVAVTLGAALVAAAHLVPTWLGLDGDEARLLTTCFRVGALAATVTLFNNSIVGYSRAVQDTALLNVTAVVSALAALAATLGLLFAGWGLWALALGMVVRAVVLLAGSAWFLAEKLGRGLRRHFRLRRAIAVEMARMSPVTAIGGLAYAVMIQSENVLVGVMLRPELVPVLALTRKGADVLRNLLDMIAWASYGGFAHLAGSSQRYRTRHVHAEIVSWHLSIGVAMAAIYAALNPSFVSRWVGAGLFGGRWLSAMMAVQMVIVSLSFLMNYLYRACGPVARGSAALIVECCARIPLMIGLVLAWGLLGVPVAAIITSSVAVVVAYRWTAAEVAPFSDHVTAFPPRVFALRFLVFAAGATTGFFLYWPSWLFIALAGAVGFSASAALLLLSDPLTARGLRSSITGMVARLQFTG